MDDNDNVLKHRLFLYSVSDKYVSFLRKDTRLSNVFDNKEKKRTHTRKYLGVIYEQNGFNYFVPFSSPKDTDYIINNTGEKVIRKNTISIIRMVTKDTKSGNLELKGTLKLSNMIPVPKEELIPYIIHSEQDNNYKMVVQKEYDFIVSNQELIKKNASIIYKEKTNQETLYPDISKRPKYLAAAVDYRYAEKRCLEFCKLNTLELPMEKKKLHIVKKILKSLSL